MYIYVNKVNSLEHGYVRSEKLPTAHFLSVAAYLSEEQLQSVVTEWQKDNPVDFILLFWDTVVFSYSFISELPSLLVYCMLT